jgi:RNA polymerase sigma factor (TIGR02999 family)
MADAAPNQITLLLEQVRHGDYDARAKLAAAVYPELKKVAAGRMRSERPNHTLQPTALVHEAFLRLVASNQIQWQNRNHFFAMSAELMRQILVDYARRRRAAKRGGCAAALELEEWQAQMEERPDLVIDIDRLITRLSSLDKRQAQIVEMRYFSGMSEKEIAEALDISERTVRRDWNMARAWMRKELSA